MELKRCWDALLVADKVHKSPSDFERGFAGPFNALHTLVALTLAFNPKSLDAFNPSARHVLDIHAVGSRCSARCQSCRHHSRLMCTLSGTGSQGQGLSPSAEHFRKELLRSPRLRNKRFRRELLMFSLASAFLPYRASLASTAADSSLPTLVTGAGSGIGHAVAGLLASQGQAVICACRTAQAAQATASELGAKATALDVGLEQSDLGSVRTYVERLSQQYPAGIGAILLCAGIEGVPLGRTPQGLECHYGINVVSHFALAAEVAALCSKRSRGPPVRIVSVTSSAAFDSDLTPSADLNWQTRSYSARLAYVNSKACNVLVADELQRRAGGSLIACSVDPGPTATQIIRYTLPQRAEQRKTMAPEQLSKQARKLSLRTPAQAAEGVAWCLQSDDCEPGALYLGRGAQPGTPPPLPVIREPVPWRTADVSQIVWRDCVARTSDFLSPSARAFVS